jgi:hypothetical protein
MDNGIKEIIVICEDRHDLMRQCLVQESVQNNNLQDYKVDYSITNGTNVTLENI